MRTSRVLRFLPKAMILCVAALLAACGGNTRMSRNEHACMARAMYFESNRSSDEGMLAVGTVVMNRVDSGKSPKTVCGVVGQKNQFAPGVLSKPMKEGQSRERAERVAAAVLAGKRHRGVGNSMFFHTAGYNFPYRNMHYQVLAGGNAFYEKRTPKAGQRNRTQMAAARRSNSGREITVAEVRRTEPARLPRATRRSQQAEPPPPERVYLAAAPAPAELPRAAPRPAAPPPKLTPPRDMGAPPLLAVAPAAPAPVSIEELILANGG